MPKIPLALKASPPIGEKGYDKDKNKEDYDTKKWVTKLNKETVHDSYTTIA